jgi:hypothetical protein
VVCGEYGIGDGSEYCGDNDAQLDHKSVLYHEAKRGKYMPRDLINQNLGAGNNWPKGHYTRAEHEFC